MTHNQPKLQKNDKPKEQKLKEWQAHRVQNHLSGEWAVAAQLGKTGFSEEEIHWVSEMFGR
ncbi:MAG: hypothetical protein J6U05_07795 [Neisseriaceae bacterium]|nr:hypothetical protein [Neisseriaceae bacterium]